MKIDPYSQHTWDIWVKNVNFASQYATPYNSQCNQACWPSSKRTNLSSKAKAYVPRSDIKISSRGWPVSSTSTILFEQVSPFGGAQISSGDMVTGKGLHSERAKTTRGRQLEPDLSTRLPSRTPSPDSSQYSHVNKNYLPVKYTFIHFDTKSSGDDEFDDSSVDAETSSGASLKESSSAPSLLMQNLTFELAYKQDEEKEEAEKIVQRQSHDLHLAHASGKCKPCAYFYSKVDSCRLGSECTFCHLCPPEALKNHRKQKLKVRRRAEIRRQLEAWPVAARGYDYRKWGYHYNEMEWS